MHDKAPWCDQKLGEALLAPTVIYVRDVLRLIEAAQVKVRRTSQRLVSDESD